MVDIFISYRHDDAGSAVALHRENIKRLFGPAVEVFLDDRSIEPGEPFPDEIRAALLGSRLVLAFAGQSYARHLRERADRVDWVREELLSAREADIPIWPILVDGQREFDAEDLPEAVRWFAELNAVTIRGASSDDGDALLRRIDEFLVRPSATSTYSFSESEWELLVEGLKEGTCVPIVGTGLGKLDYTGPPPMALRRESGDERMFSLLGGEDLPRVAQVLATERNPSHPRKKLRDWARSRSYKSRSDHPYAVLAQLGLPLYISTSYEDGLATYLEAGGGAAQRMRYSSDSGSIGSDGAEHSPALPVVLQLMGDYGDLDSLVLTEDDFFQLLVRMVTDEHFFPIECLEQLTQSTFLFVGFELADWRFRVLLRGLAQNLQSNSQAYVVVSVPDEGDQLEVEVASAFAEDYLTRETPSNVAKLDAHVHYGGVQRFTAELADRLGPRA